MLRYDRQIKPGLVTFMTSGQETERVYSYNPRAHIGTHTEDATVVNHQAN